MKPIIGITIGDINGIGAEIALKSLNSAFIRNSESIPVLISPKNTITYYAKVLNLPLDVHVIDRISAAKSDTLNVLELEVNADIPSPGHLSAKAGKIAMASIEKAIQLALSGEIQAMVTLPISKESVNLAGFKIPGHTEFLADKTNTSEVLMMLVNEGLRISLVTTHIPISKVAESITEELIIRKAKLLHESLQSDFAIKTPSIALFGLNPHAGDGGVIGSEEIDIITPAITKLKELGINADGPFPADGFFGQKLHKVYDGILAMYHDQGLAPFKLLSFGSGVNFTAGLPIIRTSPDHGTAFNIAGQSIADNSSFLKAYSLAVKLSYMRNKA